MAGLLTSACLLYINPQFFGLRSKHLLDGAGHKGRLRGIFRVVVCPPFITHQQWFMFLSKQWFCNNDLVPRFEIAMVPICLITMV